MEPQRLDLWRLRVYIAGFLASLGLDGLANGLPEPAVARGAMAFGAALLLLRMASDRVPATGWAVWLVIVPVLAFPLAPELATSAQPIAATIQSVTVWPLILTCLIGSRVLVTSGELAFGSIWLSLEATAPKRAVQSVAVQSVGGALALGLAATLVFYLVVPPLLPAPSGRPSDIVVSALKGSTFVHGAIILTFFVIVAFILDAVRLNWQDLAALNRVRSLGAGRPESADFGEFARTRAARLILAGLDAASGKPAPAFEGFHQASRRFVRSLLPFLPLLGFLGTVIGLATAIAELPRGLSGGTGQAADISASLAGLAIKFETTLLGLIASMVASLALNLLEKHEAEIAALCQRTVETWREERAAPRAAGAGADG